MRTTLILFVIACLVAAAAPLHTAQKTKPAAAPADFPGWPGSFDGQKLTPLSVSDLERTFAADFPGQVARFSDGRRELVLRWVHQPTRRLHPAADCFRGSGYTIQPRPLWRDERGRAWGCLAASRGQERLLVYERIEDELGQSWTDVSAWYWAAALGQTSGPWWSIVIAERAPAERHVTQ